LFPCRPEPDAWNDDENLYWLPPVLGTTFISGPPVSASPRPPDVRNETSWTFDVSTV
jgi:hypothetical protein